MASAPNSKEIERTAVVAAGNGNDKSATAAKEVDPNVALSEWYVCVKKSLRLTSYQCMGNYGATVYCKCCFFLI